MFLGRCNGTLPNRDRGRKCSKFYFEERDLPNGVKKGCVSVVTNTESSKVCVKAHFEVDSGLIDNLQIIVVLTQFR